MLAVPVQPAPPPKPPVDGRTCVALEFSIDKDLRFLAHRDEVRMLGRALTRAGWPLAYSHGFNPQPRLKLPLPRSVGTPSSCQWAIVELNGVPAVAELGTRLAAALPPGCRLERVTVLAARCTPHPRQVRYTVELEPAEAANLGSRLERLRRADRLVVERRGGPDKPPRPIDIRPYIEIVTLEGRVLHMNLKFVEQRTARPTEVLTALNLPVAAYAHRLRRVAVEWDIALAGRLGWPASAERNNVGQEGNCQAHPHET
jgi:radical SAM-linked protein